ncbi:GIY-YIG nuclease family protein [Salinigranum sp. GCM10025319]|uniref:GIY-YIG nuclease family protein n=1 Tax=Salinigranum sp. GCM10025319 TaxID=3252687 RepID=UPI0036075DC5
MTAPVRYGPDDRLDAVLDDPAAGGTYVLVVDLSTSVSVEVGALGVREFPAGSYAYVGSAFGPGGFSRVDRHRRHLAGDEAGVHWHVDALTTRPEASFVVGLLAPGIDIECAVARRLPPGPVDAFGSSDCDCRTHLSMRSDVTTDRWATKLADTVATVA